MKTLDVSRGVGEIVAEDPACAPVLELFHIDYCCGGGVPLVEACRARGVDLDRVVAALQQAGSPPPFHEGVDAARMSPSELTAHLVEVHHALLRRELPRLRALLDRVIEENGRKDPRLFDLGAVWRDLAAEISTHLAKEEQVLFPWIRALERSPASAPSHCGSVGNPIAVMENEHERVGEMLREIRRLTDDFTAPDWACASYRALLAGLREVTCDLHLHIHEENNLLHPHARALERGSSS